MLVARVVNNLHPRSQDGMLGPPPCGATQEQLHWTKQGETAFESFASWVKER